MKDFFCDQVREVTSVRRSVRRNARDQMFNPVVMMEPAAILAGQLIEWVRPETMRASYTRRRWTADEDRIALSRPVRAAAVELGRTESSVSIRRWRLRRDGA